MCSGRGDGQLRPPGFPIRKSPDQRLVADSPGLIAGSYVLHRLLMPRHPPCALHSLSHTPPTQPRPTATTTTQAATTTHRNQTDDAHHAHTTTPDTQTPHTQARHTQTCLCQRAQPACVSDAF